MLGVHGRIGVLSVVWSVAIACGAAERDFRGVPDSAGGQAAADGGSSDARPDGSEAGGGNIVGGTSGTGEVSTPCTTASQCEGDDECCDGSCVDLRRDPANCGACGTVCTADTAAGQCVAGDCQVETCNEGWADCDGEWSNGCETAATGAPQTPRLLRPLTGDYTGSVHAASRGTLKPTFRWEAASPGTCGALRYELQVDDSCEATNFAECEFKSPEVAVEVETTYFTPQNDLAVVKDAAPVGQRYFWRVRACDSGECSGWSEARYVDVGRLRQDVNGDGYADILVGQVYGQVSQYAVHWGGQTWAQ